MSEEVDELMDAFLALALQQRQLNSSRAAINSDSIKMEELNASALALAQKLYTKGAELERSGDITKAIELYNRAYRLDPDITRHIDHDRVAAEISQKDLQELEGYQTHPFRKLTLKANPVDRELLAQISEKIIIKADSNSNFSEIEKGTIRLTAFQSEPSFLEELPENVIEKTLFYLGWMHLPSLEAVSNMSRAMFLACRQHSLWRNLCCQMQCLKHGTQAINQKNDDSWRLQMIMRPAFRTDGIYISKITYLRQGYQESAICQPSHLVTYYRYLRFFNGPVNGGGLRFVTSYVSTESPKNGNVIEQLREVDGKTLKAIKERIFLNTTTTTRLQMETNPIEIQILAIQMTNQRQIYLLDLIGVKVIDFSHSSSLTAIPVFLCVSK